MGDFKSRCVNSHGVWIEFSIKIKIIAIIRYKDIVRDTVAIVRKTVAIIKYKDICLQFTKNSQFKSQMQHLKSLCEISNIVKLVNNCEKKILS